MSKLVSGVVTTPTALQGVLGTGSRRRRPKLWLIAPVILLLAAACSEATAGPTPVPSPSPAPTPTPVVDQEAVPGTPTTEASEATVTPTETTPSRPGAIPQPSTSGGLPPKLDTTIASVPLEEVVFDTFLGGFIRLSEATDADVERLRDAIRPIYEPVYEPVAGGRWLRDDDKVVGHVSGSGAFAYPVKILNLHEIVNDVIDGVPVLVSYCPLCASWVVYDRVLDGQVLVFGNTSALYESDLVMYDHQTGSYWFQVLGEAIVGPLTGKRLEMLPSVTTTWAQWTELHPDTKVLSQDLGLLSGSLFGSPYDRDPFVGYADRVNRGSFAFPVSEEKLDDRLRPGDMVFAVQVGESHKAYPLTDRPDAVINDEVGGKGIVVIVRARGPGASAFLGSVEGRTLTFGLDQGVVVDAETGSEWDDGGRAVSGPLAGSRLTQLPSRTSFWFSLVGSLPDIDLHTP